jgi:hypothetical protein
MPLLPPVMRTFLFATEKRVGMGDVMVVECSASSGGGSGKGPTV